MRNVPLINYEEVLVNYEPIIGIELHVELLTETKMFCCCANKFGVTPNTLVCPICLGFPGTLPVLNELVLKSAIRIGLLLNCDIVFNISSK